MKKEKKSRKRGYCIQRHHLSYEPEKIVKIYRQEHFWLTKMGWAKKTSQGFLRALKDFIKKNKKQAVKLK